jgi:pimeloyl-ACP methyl ester carboxylesterase
MQAVTASLKKTMAALGAFPQSPSSMPLVIMISGAENNLQPGRSAQSVRDEEATLLFASPLPGYLVDPPVPLYPHDALFARLPSRLPPTLVLQGDQDAKTPIDAALRHIAALRTVGPVQLYTAERVGHFVLWGDAGCAQAAVRAFVLVTQAGQRCVSVRSGD